MSTLIDPRCFAAASANTLVALAAQVCEEPDAAQRAQREYQMREALRGSLLSGDDEAVRAALDYPCEPRYARVLWNALDAALAVPMKSATLAAMIFAVPVVLVAGGRAFATIDEAVPDTGRLVQILEEAGALGAMRNFGLSASLSTREALHALPWSKLYLRLRALETGAHAETVDLEASPIVLPDADEHVALRFLTGVSVAGSDAPSFVSTGADIARWGMAMSRELQKQLALDGVTLLPLPRPPQSLLAAHTSGSRAQAEVAMQAFLSRRLREFRAREGEPRVRVGTIAPATIEVTLESMFDPERSVAHRMALHPLDEFADVLNGILELLDMCRIASVELVPGARQ